MTMTYKDYYKDLGVDKTATPAAIKKAYRALANKYHPDKTKGDKAAEEKFKAINEANGVLSDPAKRKMYDQFGADWKQYQEAGAQPGGFTWSQYAGGKGDQPHGTSTEESDARFTDEGVNELFEMVFGQQSRHRRAKRPVAVKGEDFETETALSLQEAYHGAVRLIRLNGQTIKVTIRPGVADRQMLRIAGKGGGGSEGSLNGDLYLRVKVLPHPEFQRKGNDLHCALAVGLYAALLGGKTKIKTFKGDVTVNIPVGTSNGKVLRLHGLGMPVYAKKNEFGNMLVNVAIVLPEQLSEEEKSLFEKLAALREQIPDRAVHQKEM
jgi:curved DNA-binding protein